MAEEEWNQNYFAFFLLQFLQKEGWTIGVQMRIESGTAHDFVGSMYAFSQVPCRYLYTMLKARWLKRLKSLYNYFWNAKVDVYLSGHTLRVGSDSDRSVDKTLRSNKLATSADRSADIGWSLAIGIVHLKLLVFFMQWMWWSSGMSANNSTLTVVNVRSDS